MNAYKKQSIINVGKFYVSTDSQEELLTVVGSCVALTFYDIKTHTGGMVHIVLPGRRTSQRENDRNAYYADTGVPFLIEEMRKAGARIENLVANVIGGASLNATGKNTIGRRNVNAVVTALKKYGIPIQKKDTGGKSGRKVILDIATGNIDALKLLYQSIKPAVKHEGILAYDDKSQLIRQIEHLNPDWTTAGKLLEALHNPDSSMQSIQVIISGDAVLACHIFRMCNSSYYGLPNRISSFADAMTLLGNRQLGLICTVAATMRQQETTSADTCLAAQNFNNHTRATALIARCLALRASPNLGKNAYAAGLLHSAGRLGAALLMWNNGWNKLLETDSNVFEKNVEAIGEIILTKWNIPVQIIRAAIDFRNPPDGTSDQHKLTAIIHVACCLSLLLGINSGKKICAYKISRSALAQTGLSNGLEPILPSVFEALRDSGLGIGNWVYGVHC